MAALDQTAGLACRLRKSTMREKILELLRRRPYQPIRIHLSNETVHVVRHPDQALVGPSYIIIGIPANDAPGPEISDSAFVSLLHVVQVEPLTSPTASSSN
jgi:hypothetical protein